MSEDLTHDIVRGILNGVEFDLDRGQDPQIMIKPMPCEVCGHPVWVGIIASSCGDAGRDIFEEDDDGFAGHACNEPDEPDPPDCLRCFPEEDEEEDDEFVWAPTPAMRFITESDWEWTRLPVAR